MALIPIAASGLPALWRVFGNVQLGRNLPAGQGQSTASRPTSFLS